MEQRALKAGLPRPALRLRDRYDLQDGPTVYRKLINTRWPWYEARLAPL